MAPTKRSKPTKPTKQKATNNKKQWRVSKRSIARREWLPAIVKKKPKEKEPILPIPGCTAWPSAEQLAMSQKLRQMMDEELMHLPLDYLELDYHNEEENISTIKVEENSESQQPDVKDHLLDEIDETVDSKDRPIDAQDYQLDEKDFQLGPAGGETDSQTMYQHLSSEEVSGYDLRKLKRPQM